ncbi:MAG: hypothetical protein Udaeo2_30360 [Candidatus Udaeobacter sp.]|nr:MAG: hypothetical protein Udaeo2_30360 [Candidatus Udaeobacter sp.]
MIDASAAKDARRRHANQHQPRRIDRTTAVIERSRAADSAWSRRLRGRRATFSRPLRVNHSDDVCAATTFPNVIITGHRLFTREALENIAATTIGNITDFERGGALEMRLRIMLRELLGCMRCALDR